MSWATVSANQSVFEMAELQNQQPFSENAQGQAEWGRFYFATAQVRFLLENIFCLGAGFNWICGVE
jgi:hypothetical protein